MTIKLSRYPYFMQGRLFVDDNLSVLEAANQFGIEHVLAIHQPDSQTPRRVDNWPAIDDFNEIMPDG